MIAERYWRGVLVALAIAVGVSLVGHAYAKPFWHDEIGTILGARLPVGTLWRASLDGLDLAPPLNTIVTRLVHAVFEVGPVTTRLPAMLGLMIALGLLFVMVRRRSNIVIGACAALLLVHSGAFAYGYEARGYGLTFGCFALALFAWSEAASGRQRRRNLCLMGVALAAGVWTHYYAVLAFLPMATGEVVRQWRRRQFDRDPWLALVAAALTALPLWWLVTANLAQAPTYWGRLEPHGIGATYAAVFGPLLEPQFMILGVVVVIFALAEAVRTATGGTRPAAAIPAHEIAATIASLMIPAVGVALAHASDGPFVTRHVLFAMVGIAFAISLAVWRLTPDNGMAGAIVCLGLLIPFGMDVIRGLRAPFGAAGNPVSDRPLLARQLASSEMTVVSAGLAYLPLWFYAAEDQRRFAVYLADPQSELRHHGTDTVDRGYLAMARWTSVPVFEYDAFVRDHRTFPVYACGSDWLTARLRAEGAAIEELRYELGCWLYRARLPALRRLLPAGPS